MRFLNKQVAAPLPPAMPYAGAYRRPSPRSGQALRVLMVLILVLLTAFASAVVALGSYQLTVIVLAILLVGPVIAVVHVRELLPLLLVYVLLIQGVAEEFFKLRFAVWAGSGLAFFFLGRALLEAGILRRREDVAAARSGAALSVAVAAGLYLACFFFGLALGSGNLMQNVSALRFGLPMFGLLIAMYFLPFSERYLQLLWTLIVVVVLLQPPVVVYQHFFGKGLLDWDAVVGTFGHGMSPVLVLFTLAAMLYALARWMRGLSSLWLVLLLLVAGMANILLGEVKAIAFWLPVGLMLILRQRILRNVGAFIMYSSFVALVMSATFVAYKTMYWGKAAHSGTVMGTVDKAGGYFFDPYEIKYGTGEVSRIASLYIWYRDPIPPAVNRLIGYGPGASQISDSTGFGVVAARYRPLQINATALSTLLWDVGILGALSYIALIGCAILAGWRFVVRGQGTPQLMAMVDTSMVTLVLLASTLIYNRNLLDSTTVQLLFFFCLGTIVQACRFGQRPPAAPAPAQERP
ncbi:MAG: hypothetical protein V4578_16900 [Pseudomonadota bacterium]